MKQIILRGVPPALERVLVRTASESGASLSRVVISLLEQATGLRGNHRLLHHDLDSLAGAWTTKEAATFDKSVGRCIDLEAWT